MQERSEPVSRKMVTGVGFDHEPLAATRPTVQKGRKDGGNLERNLEVERAPKQIHHSLGNPFSPPCRKVHWPEERYGPDYSCF